MFPSPMNAMRMFASALVILLASGDSRARPHPLEQRPHVLGRQALLIAETTVALEGGPRRGERLLGAELAELPVALELRLVEPLIGGRLLGEHWVLQTVLAHVGRLVGDQRGLEPDDAPGEIAPRRPAELARVGLGGGHRPHHGMPGRGPPIGLEPGDIEVDLGPEVDPAPPDAVAYIPPARLG